MGNLASLLQPTIFSCVRHGDFKRVVDYLDQGNDVNSSDTNGSTLLMAAAECGHLNIVEYLRACGADIHETDNGGNSALILSSWKGHSAVMLYLLSVGARIDRPNNNGNTAIMLAAWAGHQRVVELLLQRGANIEIRSEEGTTALMLAADKGHTGVIKLLLDAGAEVNDQDQVGWSALMFASWEGKLDAVQLLCQRGAKIDQKTSAGNVASALAEKRNNKHVISYLQDYAAKSIIAFRPSPSTKSSATASQRNGQATVFIGSNKTAMPPKGKNDSPAPASGGYTSVLKYGRKAFSSSEEDRSMSANDKSSMGLVLDEFYADGNVILQQNIQGNSSTSKSRRKPRSVKTSFGDKKVVPIGDSSDDVNWLAGDVPESERCTMTLTMASSSTSTSTLRT